MKVNWKKTSLSLILILICLTVGILYVYAVSPSGSLYIFSGMYPGAADYTIWVEGSSYFAKNDHGQLEFSGTNATTLINQVINALPVVSVKLPNPAGSTLTAPHGTILIKTGVYTIYGTIQIPLGARLMIYGEGTTYQQIGNGVNGGTQLINADATSVLECLSSRLAVTTAGSKIVLKHIEFIQATNLTDAGTSCLNLNGMSEGILENIVVVKAYGNMNQTGIGIECFNSIGGDHVGGYTYWNQIQVAGFTYGLNVSINHWKAVQLGIANCTTALSWYNNLANRIEDLHVFECDRILALYGGFTEYGHIAIHGLYLEDAGGGVDSYEWWVNSTFHSYLRIYDTNVNVGGAATLWRCNSNESIWFEDVMVTGGAPGFPAVTTPSESSGVIFVNDNMQLVEISITWTTIDALEINSVSCIDSSADNRSLAVYLRPGDYINVTGTYIWNWRAYSADRGYQDDY